MSTTAVAVSHLNLTPLLPDTHTLLPRRGLYTPKTLQLHPKDRRVTVARLKHRVRVDNLNNI